jgi:hypothetical protein
MTRLREITVRSDRVEPDRLRALLSEIDVVGRIAIGRSFTAELAGESPIVFVDADQAGGSDAQEGPGRSWADGAVVLPAETSVPLEPWIASVAARRLRRVPGADACASPGVETVLTAGRWVGSVTAELPADGDSGVLLVKPSVRATPEFLREIVQRVAECGYGVVEARAIPASRIRELALARAHYRSHCDFAERGQLTPAERAALLRIYGTPEFEAVHGRRARDIPVLPVERFIAESGIPREFISRWSDASTAARGLDSGALDGPNELGDDKYVNLFSDPRWTPDGPIFLINPHMPSVLRWWEESPSPRVAMLLARMSPQALPWPRLRAEFCGASDGARALPGSLRRDGLEGILAVPVDPGEKVDRTRNVIHLSNGPVEAIRETALWFDRPVEEQPAGRALMAGAGVNAAALLERAYLSVDGSARPFTGATAGLSVSEAAERISRGRLLDAGALACTPETARRVDAAHALLPSLLADALASAVLISGSCARNRSSRDSDVDLVVIAPRTHPRTERREMDGLLFECEWMDEERARHVAAGGDRRDLKGLREASRLACAIAIHDPANLAAELRAIGNAVVPSLAELDERLTRAVVALDTLVASAHEPGFVQWEILRGIQDVLAVTTLSLHPLRYQKAKWVVADLVEIGRGDLAEALLRGYASSADAAAALRTVRAVEGIFANIADEESLPGVEAVLAHGFVERFPGWSYACRTLADVVSLLGDGSAAAADYTAKFAARLALRLDTDGPAAVPAPLADAAQGSGSAPRMKAYRCLFSAAVEVPPPTDDDLELCAEWVRWIIEARERSYRG